MQRDSLFRFFLVCVAVIGLFMCIYLPSLAEEDSLTQTIISAMKEGMQSKGFSEDQYTIEIDENGEIQLVLLMDEIISKAQVAATSQPESFSEGREETKKIVTDSVKLDDDFTEHYFLAMEYEEAGDILSAVQAFLQIPDFADASLHILQNARIYAEHLMENEEYKAAQTFLMQYPSEETQMLLAECNDVCFLTDMANGLIQRWDHNSVDVSLFSDKKIREYYTELVRDELEHVGMYANLSFLDPTLAECAYAYIGALQNQLVGASFYGNDEAAYREYWEENGQNARVRLIYLINRKFGLEIPDTYTELMKDMITQGKDVDFEKRIALSFTKQLHELELDADLESAGNLHIKPFSIYNLTDYEMGRYSVDMFFYNYQGQVVASDTNASWGHEVQPNGILLFKYGAYVDDVPFAQIGFTCEFEDENLEVHCVEIMLPYSWDGKKFTGRNEKQEPHFVLADGKGVWKKQYGQWVPFTEMTIQNDGNADGTSVEVTCVFVDPATKLIVDEQKLYLVSNSTSPLRTGYSKLGFIYSENCAAKTAGERFALEVEIYINGEAAGTISIEP